MSREHYSAKRSEHNLLVYPGGAFRCLQGVNSGEAFKHINDICLGDTYRMDFATEGERILLRGPDPKAQVAWHYQNVTDRAEFRAEFCLIVMTESGVPGQMRLLESGEKTWILPVGTLDIFAPQTIISIAPIAAPLPLADPTCLAFARGTRITLQDGSLRAVEDIRDTDVVLTRDRQGAAVLGVLHDKVPAVGRHARIIIREGAFANESELVVAAAHRLFVPERRCDLSPYRQNRMEPAHKLINGLTITPETGGTVEYFHVLMKRHEIIYAEGIPCESFLLDSSSRAGLTDRLAAQVTQLAPQLCHAPHPLSLTTNERRDLEVAKKRRAAG